MHRQLWILITIFHLGALIPSSSSSSSNGASPYRTPINFEHSSHNVISTISFSHTSESIRVCQEALVRITTAEIETTPETSGLETLRSSCAGNIADGLRQMQSLWNQLSEESSQQKSVESESTTMSRNPEVIQVSRSRGGEMELRQRALDELLLVDKDCQNLGGGQDRATCDLRLLSWLSTVCHSAAHIFSSTISELGFLHQTLASAREGLATPRSVPRKELQRLLEKLEGEDKIAGPLFQAEDLAGYYETRLASIAVENDRLRVSLRIPMVDKESGPLELVHLQGRGGGDSALVTDRTGSFHRKLTALDLQKCQLIKRTGYLCPHRHIGVFNQCPEGKNLPCSANSREEEASLFEVGPDTFSYFLPFNTTIKVVCQHQQKGGKQKLQQKRKKGESSRWIGRGSGIMWVPPHCSIASDVFFINRSGKAVPKGDDVVNDVEIEEWESESDDDEVNGGLPGMTESERYTSAAAEKLLLFYSRKADSTGEDVQAQDGVEEATTKTAAKAKGGGSGGKALPEVAVSKPFEHRWLVIVGAVVGGLSLFLSLCTKDQKRGGKGKAQSGGESKQKDLKKLEEEMNMLQNKNSKLKLMLAENKAKGPLNAGTQSQATNGLKRRI